eukprot:scaffold111801_cov57-Phaeocystis_antarctica.AAC.4
MVHGELSSMSKSGIFSTSFSAPWLHVLLTLTLTLTLTLYLREQRVRQLHVLQPVGDQLHGGRARQQVGNPQARATSDTRAARLHPIHARLHRSSVRAAGRARGGRASLIRTGRDATLVPDPVRVRARCNLLRTGAGARHRALNGAGGDGDVRGHCRRLVRVRARVGVRVRATEGGFRPRLRLRLRLRLSLGLRLRLRLGLRLRLRLRLRLGLRLRLELGLGLRLRLRVKAWAWAWAEAEAEG